MVVRVEEKDVQISFFNLMIILTMHRLFIHQLKYNVNPINT
jgi:hypothetical protein